MTGVFESYQPPLHVYDEMFDSDNQVRDAYAGVYGRMEGMSPDEIRARADYLASSYVDQGVTFDIGGVERPFPLDLIPRVIAADDWDVVQRGVAQRVRTLEAFLDDVYGAGAVFSDGVIPRAVVTSSEHFHRVVAGVTPPNGVRVHVSGIDLVRDADGTFRVLEDNARIPSGVSYVLTNRRSSSTVLPEVLSSHRIQPVDPYPTKLLASLRASAPSGISNPTVVVLTPGVYNSAYFEHALLARLMGCHLVEGRDLVCQSGRVLLRTTHGLLPVHVIYRRVDDDFLDPVYFRKDSMLGSAGLINAVRAGNVTLANAVGNGVSDDKLVYTYLPDLVRYYLAEELILPNVDTWRMEEPTHREEVLDRIGELVLKPVDGSGGKGILIGPQATREEIDAMRARVLNDPRGWIAQPVVQLSTVPTLADGRPAPRHVDLRPFAVNDGTDVWVLPGGLTRVALGEGELIVNSSRGGGSKDTWVMAGSGFAPGEELPELPPRPKLTVAAVTTAFGGDAEEQQQQQQQQQQAGPAAGGLVAPC